VLDANRPPRLARSRGRARRLHSAGRLLRADGRRKGLFTIEDALDAIIKSCCAVTRTSSATNRPKPPAIVKRIWSESRPRKRPRKGVTGKPAGRCAAHFARAGGGAADYRARRSSGIRLGEPEQVLDKLHEELGEFAEARRGGSHAELEGELGDLLFVLVKLARFVKVDPDTALRATNAKFRQRFGYIERKLVERGKKPSDATIEEMEALWQEAKR